MTEPRNCPDCHTSPGDWHHNGCDVARCQNPTHDCHQLIGTECEGTPEARDWWDGEWPGTLPALNLGLTFEVAGHTHPDLNTLIRRDRNAMRTRSVPRPQYTPVDREIVTDYDVLSTYEGSPHGWSLDCVGLPLHAATSEMIKRAFRWDEIRAESLTEAILSGWHDPTTIYRMDETNDLPTSWWVINPESKPYPPLPQDTP